MKIQTLAMIAGLATTRRVAADESRREVFGGQVVTMLNSEDLSQAVEWPSGFRGVSSQDDTARVASQEFSFPKYLPGGTSGGLGAPASDWATDGTSEPLRSGDTVAWYHPTANKVYDCAGSTCSLQPFPLPNGHWGSPYRIYLLDGSAGDPIYFGDSVYFDRMVSGSYNPSAALQAINGGVIGGVDMGSRTVFVITPGGSPGWEQPDRSNQAVCSDECRLVYDLMQQGGGHICNGPDAESEDECAASGGVWRLWESEQYCTDRASRFRLEMAGIVEHWDADCTDCPAASGFTPESFLAFVRADVLQEVGETCCAGWTQPPPVPQEVLYQGVLPRDDLVRVSVDADLGRIDDEQRWDAAAVDLHLIHRVLVSHWARRPG